MPYEIFCKEIQRRADEAGLYVEFNHVDGKHIAYLSNGYRVYGNTVAPSILFKNRNHSFKTTL